ncbi:MAG TPA: NUDIX hydrolase [Acidimicrobiales bacterium]|nr:NUDIX hydrolase [Acidimicrobiales bacterium]
MATFKGTDLGRSTMTEDHRYSVSVAGVVVDDAGRALIIQRRDNGHWEPPGGILEHGETIEDGLVREVYEETGLKVEPGPLTGVYQNMTRSIVALVFRCRRVDGELTSNSEVAALRWASAADARASMTPAYAVRVLDALDYTAQPAVRAHDGTNLW